MTEAFVVENQGATLYCEKQGSGPVLLLVHGAGCDRYFYAEAAGYLSKHFTVIIYDRRGYADSKIADGAEMSVSVQASDVLAVLDAADAKKAYLAGSSAGALLLLEVLRTHPERIEKMFLHEPPVGVIPEHREEILAWADALKKAYATGSILRVMTTFIKKLGGVDPNAPANERVQETFDEMKLFMDCEIDDFLHYGERLPKQFDCHGVAVTLAGGADDMEGLFTHTAESIAAYLGCEFHRVPGYHNFAFDRAERYVQELLLAFDR